MSANEGRPHPGIPDLEAFSRMSSELYKQWEDSVAGWWDQAVESPGFLDSASKSMGGLAALRAQYEQQMDDGLSKMHLPSKGDITRLARISNLLERRLLDMEDRLLELKDSLAERDARAARMEAELVQARIEAAEARIEQREQLRVFTERLAVLEASAKPATRKKSSPRKAAAGSES
jgi:TolA-binding protein